MKTFKRIAALLLVAVMVAAFASCGESAPASNTSSNGENSSVVETTTAAPEASIVGTWKYNLDLSYFMEKGMDSYLEDVEEDQKEMYEEIFNAFKGVSFDLIMEFTDETCTFQADENSIKTALNQVKENMIKILPNIIESMGMDYDEYLETAGVTEEELAEQLLKSMDENSFAPETTTGSYSLEGDKLYIASSNGKLDKSSYCVIELTADTFTITDVVGDSSSFSDYKDIFLPMEFTRV